MHVKISVNFYFKGNGKKKVVEWEERDPALVRRDKESGEELSRTPITDTLTVAYQISKLLTGDKQKVTLADSTGTVHIIDIDEVRDIEINVTKIEEEQRDAI